MAADTAAATAAAMAAAMAAAASVRRGGSRRSRGTAAPQPQLQTGGTAAAAAAEYRRHVRTRSRPPLARARELRAAAALPRSGCAEQSASLPGSAAAGGRASVLEVTRLKEVERPKTPREDGLPRSVPSPAGGGGSSFPTAFHFSVSPSLVSHIHLRVRFDRPKSCFQKKAPPLMSSMRAGSTSFCTGARARVSRRQAQGKGAHHGGRLTSSSGMI